MKIRLHPSFSLALLLLTFNASADVLFKESFDEVPYALDVEIPEGVGQLEKGHWGTNNPEGNLPKVSDETAASKPHSIVLSVESGERSGVTAAFGTQEDQPSAMQPALKVRFSFCATMGSDTDVIVYSREEALAYMQIVANRESPFVRPWFAGVASESQAPISLNVWYTVEISLPAHPDASSVYGVKIWESGQPEPTEALASGAFYNEPSSNSSYRALNLTNLTPGSRIHFDDILVETNNE